MSNFNDGILDGIVPTLYQNQGIYFIDHIFWKKLIERELRFDPYSRDRPFFFIR